MKFTAVILTLALATVSAFVGPPKVPPARQTSVAASFDSELGAQAPLGFFDPFGILDGADQERFDRLRYVELKHGRIAMLAVLGQIVTKAGIRLPGDIDLHGTSFSSIDTGFNAFNQIPEAGLYQMLVFIFFLEISVMKDQAGTFGNEAAPGAFPGDFRNGYIDFGWDKFSEDQKMKKRAIELNNGRAAQMGILALMVHEQLGVSLWPGGI